MSEPVTVRILDREYTVGVGDAERDSLTAAARMLDTRMREVRGGNKLVAPDRLAVLTALNLAHELLQQQHPPATRGGDPFTLLDEANRKLEALLALG
ncbi:cell division protein ZapA [Thermomonas sp.]|uniref:cell division protein ZapA n=1 Tax=Thermomonas sp. TaxID=1971895 RepID=UPI0035B0788F